MLKEGHRARAEASLAYLIESLRAYETQKANLAQNSLKLQTAFEKAGAELYRLRAHTPLSHPFRRYFEDRFSEATFAILSIEGSEKPIKSSAYSDFYRDYRRIWRENVSLFLLVLFVFVISLTLGWFYGTKEPEYASLLLGPEFMEKIIGGKRWFESIQDQPLLMGFQIGLNNILVAIKAATGAALAGVGGFVILIFNGLMIGSLVGFSYAHGFEAAIGEFVVAHGVLELSIIVAACFMGLLFGRGFYMWPPRLMRVRLAAGAKESLIVALGCLPWLVLAAIVEAFVSPFYYFSSVQKLVIGALVAGLFWVWTFWPISLVVSKDEPFDKA